jgi:protocatechuate 3,4-dioxygenase beta subunit
MRRIVLNALLISLVACGNTTSARPGSAPRAQEPVAGPCEGCEAVFNGMPATLSSRARIAPAAEWGEPLTITGKVYGPDGAPRGGVVVYAYQTNAGGVYPPADGSHRHGLLRGWVVSDASGAYAFDTIRPGSYPGRTDPAHVHMHVIERGCTTYYIDDIVFTDDPRLTVEHERQMSRGRGGKGVATPTRTSGRWSVVRDIHLGMNIPDYPQCAER